MNVSLRKRLFAWLSTPILAAGIVAAAASFYLSYEDANELQDAQLQQVARITADGDLSSVSTTFNVRDDDEAEEDYVIQRLDSSAPSSTGDGSSLLVSLKSGLHTVDLAGFSWRVVIAQKTDGRRFLVAQRMSVRDEVAFDAAVLTLVPLVTLIPMLLLVVGVVLRQAFAPLTAMSSEVDRLDGSDLAHLDEGRVLLEALPLVQAVNRLLRRLTMVLDQQRRLVSDAAHELRTPVAALIVQADNVQHVLPPEARPRMSALRQGLTRMSALIEQLLSFARVQGAAPTARQPLELNAVVRTAIEEILPLAQAKGVDLGCVRLDPVVILGDPLHAQALVRNAIDNAVRYTPSGGAVDVGLISESAEITFTVEDTGPGIAQADIERVFEPFVRVLGNQESGSGLGLAIALTSAHALGGRIELTQRLDLRSGLRFIYRQTGT